MLNDRAHSDLVLMLTTVHAARDHRIHGKELRALRAAGYDVKVAAPRSRTDAADVDEVITLDVPKSPVLRILTGPFHALKAVRRSGASIVHFHDPELLLAAPLLRLFGATLVYDVHESVPAQVRSKRWIPALIRRPIAAVAGRVELLFSRACSLIVVATPTLEERFAGRRTALVQNFAWPGSTDVPKSSHPSLIYTGSLSKQRGLDIVLDALAIVRRTHPDVVLTLAGRFNPQSLQDAAEAHEAWPAVDYVGWVDPDDLDELTSPAWVGLALQRSSANADDAQPVKFFEYLRSGVPVVATDQRRMVEIAKGCNAVYFTDESPVSVAMAVLSVLRSDGRGELSEAARDFFDRRFSFVSEAETLVNAYADLAPRPAVQAVSHPSST